MNDAKTLAQQFIDALHALEKGDGTENEKLAQLFSPDAKLANAALESAGRNVSGRDEIASFWAEYKSALGDCISIFITSRPMKTAPDFSGRPTEKTTAKRFSITARRFCNSTKTVSSTFSRLLRHARTDLKSATRKITREYSQHRKARRETSRRALAFCENARVLAPRIA